MKEIKNKNIKWWIGTISCVMLFVFIGGFAFMKMNFIFKGVQIEANINRDNSSIAEIKGNAKNATHISLNGREIFIDKEGSFTEPIALLPGFSVMTLEAQDKFGNRAEKKFEVVYKGESPTVALLGKTY
jgi:hypothetical protein